MQVFKNKFSSKCVSCGTGVGEGDGFCWRDTGKYHTVCASSACINDVGIFQPTSQSQRELTPKGEILITPWDWAALPIIRSIPGASFNSSTKTWFVSTAPADRDRVVSICNTLNLTLPDGFERGNVDPRSVSAIERAIAVGAYPYQREGVAYLAGRDKALLADDMGLGKTLQALIALPEGAKAIFVCPASLKRNVANEVLKWRKDLRPIVISGKNNFVHPSEKDVVILNYEILPSDLDWKDKFGNEIKGDEIFKEGFKDVILIADEVHVCKSHTSIKSKRVKSLSKLCSRVWAMTGTPILSKPLDLWGILSAFGMERDVFGNWKNFIEMFDGEKVPVSASAFKWVFGKPSPQVPTLLRKLMLRRLKSGVLKDLPAKTYQDILVEVSSQKLIKKSNVILNDIKDLKPNDPLPNFTDFSKVRAELASDRIPALIEILDNFEEAGEPVVVFSAHKAPIDALRKRVGWEVITGEENHEERAFIVKLFQEGKLEGVGLTIKAGGVGLTLTRASKMIFVDREWNPALNTQAEDRICRIGQQAESLQYIRLVSNCAMDIHVNNILSNKTDMIQAAIEENNYQPEYSPPQSSQIQQETPEERDERKKNISKKLEEAQARSKVSAQRHGWSRGCNLPDPSPAQVQDICDALDLMLNKCDGALSKDEVGFNKPDSYTMRTVKNASMVKTDVALQKFVWGTLRKYQKQLEISYPSLF